MSLLTNGYRADILDHVGECQEIDQKDAIAIVGMACRFPQDAENPEKLWDMLMNSRSAATEFPENKMNMNAHYHPDPAHGGTVSSWVWRWMKIELRSP